MRRHHQNPLFSPLFWLQMLSTTLVGILFISSTYGCHALLVISMIPHSPATLAVLSTLLVMTVIMAEALVNKCYHLA